MSDSSVAKAIVGTWHLGDSYSEKSGGRTDLPVGGKVTGQINCEAASNMAAQLIGADRPHLSSRNPQEVSDEEFRIAFKGYTSYFGTYTIDTSAGTITHHVVGASVPNWPGHDQIRYFELSNLCKSGGPRPIAALHGVLRCSNIPYKLRPSNTVRLALRHAHSLLQRFLKWRPDDPQNATDARQRWGKSRTHLGLA